MAVNTRRNWNISGGVVIPPPPPVTLNWQQGYAFYEGFTTGGGNETPVHVYNYNELKTQLSATDPKVIIAHGTISGTSATVNSGFNGGSNKTLLGAPGCIFNGFGISFFHQNNIIIRNIKFQGMPDFLAAGVSKRDYLTFYNVQRMIVNHCHFIETVGTDSHMDIIDASDWITVSDCYFQNGDKGSLCGAGVESARELNKLHASYFRNRWVDIMERAPSYRKGSYCHVLNDLHQSPTLDWQYTYAAGSRNGATIRVENCDFTEFNGWAGQAINSDANSTEEQEYGFFSGIDTNLLGPDATFNLKGQPESSWVPPYEYDSFKIPVGDVKAYVLANAGATLTLEQMGHGTNGIATTIPYGYGATVTGGDGGTNMQVYTATEYFAALNTTGVRNIQVMNDITYNGGSNSGSRKPVKSNCTIWSTNGRTIRGVSHSIFSGTTNVKFVNIRLRDVGYDNDALQVNNTKGLFINHCEFGWDEEYWLSPAAEGTAGDPDGCMDWTNGGDCTISHCKIVTFDKVFLLVADAYTGTKPAITMHDNYFNRVRQRVPALRGTDGHIFNNYFLDSAGGNMISIADTTQALIEENVLSDCPKGLSFSDTYPGPCSIDPKYTTHNSFINGSNMFDPSDTVSPVYETFNPPYTLPAGVVKSRTEVVSSVEANSGCKIFELGAGNIPVRVS